MKKEIPKRRAGYYYLDNVPEPLPSVTTILSKVLRKPGLEYWKCQVSVKAALHDPSRTVEECIAETYKVRDKAANEGLDVHKLIERGEYEVDKLPPQAKSYIEAYEAWCADMPHKRLGAEQTVYSREHKFAGTMDKLIQLDDGKVVLVDIKTSNNLYPEMGLQLSAYKHAILELGIVSKIDTIAILQLKDNGTYTWAEYDDTFEVFLACLKIFNYLEK